MDSVSRSKAYVYMLRSQHDFKLGLSKDPLQRMESVALPGEVSVTKSLKFAFPSIRRAKDAEIAAKHVLAPHRSRLTGTLDGYTEWFLNDAWDMALELLAFFPEAKSVPLMDDDEFFESPIASQRVRRRSRRSESPAVFNERRASHVRLLFHFVPSAIRRSGIPSERRLLLHGFRPLWVDNGSTRASESRWDPRSEWIRRRILDSDTFDLKGKATCAESMVEKIYYGTREDDCNDLTIIFRAKSKIQRLPGGDFVWFCIQQILRCREIDEVA